MIQSFILYTSEVDIAEDAVREITTQLQAFQLLSHSVGIAICHSEFVHTGVMAAIGEALPFDVVGLTTFSQMNGAARGMFELSVLVLTGDDVFFDALPVGPAEEAQAPSMIADAYKSVSGNGDPALILAFLPFDLTVSGDAFLRYLDSASGGVPCFGAYSIDNNQSLLGKSASYTLFNGEAAQDKCIFLSLRGNVRASFYVASYPRERLIDQSAVVTKSDGRLVREVNGMPIVQYLRRLGIDSMEEGALSAMPVLCRMENGDDFVARAMIAAEGDSIRFISEVPEGCTLYLGVWRAEDVTETSCGAAARAIRENGDAAALLMFSCLGRYAALGLETEAEIDCVYANISDKLPALMAYSGGEIAPSIRGGQMVNTAHNTSFVICALK